MSLGGSRALRVRAWGPPGRVREAIPCCDLRVAGHNSQSGEIPVLMDFLVRLSGERPAKSPTFTAYFDTLLAQDGNQGSRLSAPSSPYLSSRAWKRGRSRRDGPSNPTSPDSRVMSGLALADRLGGIKCLTPLLPGQKQQEEDH